MEDIINRIANLEYDLFVANPHAIAIQQMMVDILLNTYIMVQIYLKP